jgi:uncharacterized protein (DUF1778 family)
MKRDTKQVRPQSSAAGGVKQTENRTGEPTRTLSVWLPKATVAAIDAAAAQCGQSRNEFIVAAIRHTVDRLEELNALATEGGAR